jgi:dCTP deaminase
MLRANSIAERLMKGLEAGMDLSIDHSGDGATDPLVITPSPDLADLKTSGSASIDLRLGTWFVSLRQTRMSHLEVDDPALRVQFTKTHYVPFGDSYFLHPRSFVLGTTLEWMRLPRDLAAYVIGRSSWGRRGLIIATATGVHPGFKGCLTLEITNVGEIPIAIKPGVAICQLFFHEVHGPIPEGVDRSQFSASRKPRVGRIGPDQFFQSLTNSPQVAWIVSQARLKATVELESGRSVKDMLEYLQSLLDNDCKKYLDTVKELEFQSVLSQIRATLCELARTQ